MNKNIRVIKLHYKENQQLSEYNGNPEECIQIVEKLRQEAMAFLYGNQTSFQRAINVIRRK